MCTTRTIQEIFDLPGGAASDMFTDNFNEHATCEIDGNGDVIMTINRPMGTWLLVR